MTLQAVFFDMGGTIETFDWTPQLRLQRTAGLQRLLAEAGIHLRLSDEELCSLVSAGLGRYHQLSLQTMEELPSRRVWNEFIFHTHLQGRVNSEADAEKLMLYIETNYYQRTMRPEMPAVLAAIRRLGLKIGLISNVNSRGQVPANLEAYGIRHYFDPIVLSSEYGRRKPDPAIFHQAARLAGVPTSACVYVGDRIARDILGARKAGYRAAVQVLHDFDHQEKDEGAVPDLVISDMTPLPGFIEGLFASPKAIHRDLEPSGLCALLFDAGDILYHRPERGRYLAAYLKQAGLDGQAFPVEIERNLRRQAYTGLITQAEYRTAVLHLYGLLDAEQVARGIQAMDADDNNVRFFPGVRETLQELKGRGWLLGIITDTANPIHVKLKWFEQAGIGSLWDAFVSSCEVGLQKPEPGIYAAALHQLGVPASRAAFIGHDAGELAGARSLGMKTIALNYGKTATADACIGQFSDLLTVPFIAARAAALVGEG